MSELFSIQLQNRQQQGRDGVWLDLPTTTEQVQAALRQIGISSDNPQGLFISGYFAEEEKRFAIPYNMVLASNVDELNFLASRLETLSTGERAELNAALQAPQSELFSIGRITDFPENVDYYVHLPDVRGPAQLGDYYLNRSGMVDMPERWKGGIEHGTVWPVCGSAGTGCVHPVRLPCQKRGRVAESPRGPARAGGIPGAVLSRAGSSAGCGQHPAACSA